MLCGCYWQFILKSSNYTNINKNSNVLIYKDLLDKDLLLKMQNKEESIINYLYGRYHNNRNNYDETLFFLEKNSVLPYPIKVARYKMLIKIYFLTNQRKKSIKFAKELIEFAETQGLKDYAKRYTLFNKEF